MISVGGAVAINVLTLVLIYEQNIYFIISLKCPAGNFSEHLGRGPKVVHRWAGKEGNTVRSLIPYCRFDFEFILLVALAAKNACAKLLWYFGTKL